MLCCWGRNLVSSCEAKADSGRGLRSVANEEGSTSPSMSAHLAQRGHIHRNRQAAPLQLCYRTGAAILSRASAAAAA